MQKEVKQAMELIERYVYAIGKRLPKKQREDVKNELRSLLMDALEDRSRTSSDAFSEEEQVAVLQEFGPPAEVAARYTPKPQYLIGPRLFKTYKEVVGIVLGVTALGILISLIVNLAQGDGNVWFILRQVGHAWTSYLSSAAGGIGSVTIVFAILERTLPDAELDSLSGRDEPWDPRSLPVLAEDHDQIQSGGIIAGICFIILALVIFNFFPEKMRIVYLTTQQETAWLPLFSTEALQAYLPLWNLAGLGLLGLNIYLLRQRRWQPVTRIVDMALTAFCMVILVRMLTGPLLVAVEGWPSVFGDATGTLVNLLKSGLRWAFIIGLVISAIDLVQQGYRLYRTALDSNASESTVA